MIAHRRFLIERFHEEVKMELGLDHFEGRRWRGLNHHLTLMLIAHTFLVREQVRASVEGAEERGAPEEGEEPLPTLAEMRGRLVFEVAWALMSRAVYARRKDERVGWGKAITKYWAGAGSRRARPGEGTARPRVSGMGARRPASRKAPGEAMRISGWREGSSPNELCSPGYSAKLR